MWVATFSKLVLRDIVRNLTRMLFVCLRHFYNIVWGLLSLLCSSPCFCLFFSPSLCPAPLSFLRFRHSVIFCFFLLLLLLHAVVVGVGGVVFIVVVVLVAVVFDEDHHHHHHHHLLIFHMLLLLLLPSPPPSSFFLSLELHLLFFLRIHYNHQNRYPSLIYSSFFHCFSFNIVVILAL